MRPSPRIRRLNSDYRSICQLRDESSIFTFESTGSPPQKYELVFHGSGFYRDPDSGKIEVRDRHRVVVEFGAAYPRMMPGLAWKTPIFHPNISNNGVVCLGGYGTHWVPSLTLAEMTIMLWDMIRYKNYDSDSPYNREAALWTKTQSEYSFPIDTRSIRDHLTGEENDNRVQSPKKVAPPAKKKPSPWGILSRLVSSEPPLPTRPIDPPTEPASDTVIESGIEILEAESTGIHIIDAQIVDPTPAEDAVEETVREQATDSGIVFLN